MTLASKLSKVAILLSVLLALPSVAHAQAPSREDDATRRAARELAQRGVDLMNAGKHAEAQDLLRRAYELVPAPTVALLEGQALEKMGKLVEAAERFEIAKRGATDPAAPPAFREAAEQARLELQRINIEIPSVTLIVKGVPTTEEGLEVKLDQSVVPSALLGVPRPVNPGQHLVTVSLGKTVHDSRWVTLTKGEEMRVLLRVEAPPMKRRRAVAPPLPPEEDHKERRTLGWITIGAGGAGLLTGVVAGAIMLSTKEQLDNQCRPTCPPDQSDELDTFRSARMVSAVGYAIGFTGIGIGSLLVLTAGTGERRPVPPKGPRMQARLGVGQLFVTGDF